MKKVWIVRALTLIAYCTPFAYLSVYGDGVHGTMLFYGVMIAGFTLLCAVALKTRNIAILYIGNILSSISSYAVAKFTNMEPMGYYFKPLTAYSLMITICIVAVVIQTIIVLILKSKKSV